MTVMIRLWLVLASVWCFSGMAWAQSDLGHFCFQLTPFDDVLDLHVIQPVPPDPFFSVHVVWNGANVYEFQGAGAVTQVGAILSMTTRYEHNTAFFGGNPVGHLYASINPATLSGPYAFDFQGTNPPFVNGGELVLVTCDAISALMDSHSTGALAGNPE